MKYPSKNIDQNDPNWVEISRLKAREVFQQHSLPRWMVFFLDWAGIYLSFIFSYLLRYNFVVEAMDAGLAFKQSILVTAIYCFFELIFRSFAGLIRHTTIRDIFNVVIATSSALVILLIITVLGRSLDWDEIAVVPISILLIHFVSLNALLFIVRILIKIFYEMVTIESMTKKNIINMACCTVFA